MRCPVCKANNNFEDETATPTCRRCRANLSLLVAAERQHVWALEQARFALADHQFSKARRFARQAHDIRSNEETRQMLAVCYLMEGDFAKAWECHQAMADV